MAIEDRLISFGEKVTIKKLEQQKNLKPSYSPKILKLKSNNVIPRKKNEVFERLYNSNSGTNSMGVNKLMSNSSNYEEGMGISYLTFGKKSGSRIGPTQAVNVLNYYYFLIISNIFKLIF